MASDRALYGQCANVGACPAVRAQAIDPTKPVPLPDPWLSAALASTPRRAFDRLGENRGKARVVWANLLKYICIALLVELVDDLGGHILGGAHADPAGRLE